MKKIYLALMCMASLAIVTACGGNKSNNTQTATEGEATEQVAEGQEPADQSLVGTKWTLVEELENNDYSKIERIITFEKGGICKYDINYYDESGNLSDESRKFAGPYTFDGDRGELNLKAADGASTPDAGTISLDETILSVKYYDGTWNLEKAE